MGIKDFVGKITGSKPADKPEEKPKPPEQKLVPQKPEPPSAAEQRKQAAKDRVTTAGPAERHLVQNPDVLKKALDAKAERDSPKPNPHDYSPPSQPKPGPSIQTPGGMMRATPQTWPPKPPQPAAPAPPRKPTNADRMLDRAKNTPPPPPKPPPKSFREVHPGSAKGRSR